MTYMKKLILLLLLAIGMGTSLYLVQSPNSGLAEATEVATAVSFSPATATVAAGKSQAITVIINSGSTADSLEAMDLTLTYDSTKFSYGGFVASGGMTVVDSTTLNPTAGKVRLFLVAMGNETKGTVQVGKLTLTALKKGTTTLTPSSGGKLLVGGKTTTYGVSLVQNGVYTVK